MEKEFHKVLIDREKLINDEFTMGILDGTTKKLPPLQEYIDFMLQKKTRKLSIFPQRRVQVFAMEFIAI